MLLDGSFSKDILNILDALKLTRRRLIHEGKLGMNDKVVQFVVSAATLPSSGERSVQSTLQRLFPAVIVITFITCPLSLRGQLY